MSPTASSSFSGSVRLRQTTTLRVVAGFAEPTSGAVRLGERDITSSPLVEAQSALVFQNYALFPHLTVAQNVAFGLEMRRSGRPR